VTTERGQRAERLGPYFEAQLRLAARMTQITGADLGDMAYRHTNLHRRFGQGHGPGTPTPLWLDYAARLEALPDLATRVRLTQETFVNAAEEVTPLPGQIGFGCFAHEPPTDEGVVKIHFNNRDTDDEGGPLALAKAARRRAELTEMLAHIREAHPGATRLVGRSWLYHLESYRRLFPPYYVASRVPAPGRLQLSGTSTWGQLIDSREAIRPAARDALYKGLKSLDPNAPWRAFPLHPLAVSAPLETFYAFYGV